MDDLSNPRIYSVVLFHSKFHKYTKIKRDILEETNESIKNRTTAIYLSRTAHGRVTPCCDLTFSIIHRS